MNVHMRPILGIVILVVIPGLTRDRAFAQSISLPGTVVIQNSEYETGHRQYVSDASIRAPFAKAITTDKDGQFALGFAGVGSGTPVRLTVSKPGLEVVNTKETEQVILGRAQGLQVVMADPDKLAAAQVKYYNIATESITRTFEKKLAVANSDKVKLEDRLHRLSAETGHELATLGDAIVAVTRERDEALQHAQDLARRFAEVDLDDASDRYRRAFELFQRGQVDSVMSVLNDADLENDYRTASDEKSHARQFADSIARRADASIRRSVDSYQLKADVANASLQYGVALGCFKAMRTIANAQSDVIDPLLQVFIRERIALALMRLGQYDSSIAVLREGMDIGERLLSPAHAELGIVHADIAMVLGATSRPKEAVVEMQQAIAISTQALGEQSAQVGEHYSGLGALYFQMADYPAAKEWYQKSRAILEKVLEPDDTRMYDLLQRESMLRTATGLYPEARKGFEEFLAYKVRKLGPDHPEVAQAHKGLATCLTEMGDYDGSFREQRECLRIQLKTLGPEHPELADTYDLIGLVFRVTGQADSALAMFARSMEISARSYGPDHPLVGNALSSIGALMREKGDPAGSLDPLRKGLAIRIKSQGATSPIVGVSYNEIGSSLLRLGETDSALYYYVKGIGLLSAALGPEHPAVAKFDLAIGNCLSAQGYNDSAITRIRGDIAIMSHALGATHPAVASAQITLGKTFLKAERPDSALVHFRTGLDVMEKTMAADNPDLAYIHNNMAVAMALTGDTSAAIDLAHSSGRIYAAANGTNNPDVATLHVNIARILEHMAHFSKALAELDTALAIRTKVFGSHYRFVGATYALMGRVAYENSDHKRALRYLAQAEEIRPTAETFWLQYRMANESGDSSLSLDRLVRCARARATEPATTATDREKTREALKSLAIKLGRQDVLQEFHLN